MPTSAPYAIPVIVHAVRQMRPRSILDIGVGFGKYGMLFREYLDIWNAEGADELRPGGWRTRIEGVEVFPPYLTPLHEYIYDRIHVGDIRDLIHGLGAYDLIFMGDVLEHFPPDAGRELVRTLVDHANRCVLLTYPRNAKRRGALLGNEAEAHHSSWCRMDFNEYERVAYTTLEDRADVCAIAKPPHHPPFLVGCFAARRRSGWKGRIASGLVRLFGPSYASRLATRMTGETVALRAE